MAISDPIADMLTRIRNANMVGHKSVEIPASNMKVKIARILEDEGFVSGVDLENEGTNIVEADIDKMEKTWEKVKIES